MAAERAFADRLDAIEKGMVAYQKRMDSFSATLITLGDDVTSQGITVQDLTGQTSSAVDQVNAQFDLHKKALIDVVNHARNEFDTLRSGLTALYGGTGTTFADFKDKVDTMQRQIEELTSKGTGGLPKARGFLPLKEQVPKTFGKNEGEWRAWQDDVSTYLDMVMDGVKDALKDAEKETKEIDTDWFAQMGQIHSTAVLTMSRDLHRALKTLTEDEARLVVQGVRAENGYEAWRLLHMRYGLSSAAKQGQVMGDVISIVQKPCKTPADTRARVIELERRVRLAEEVTGKTLDDNHVKSVLAAILDPLTRAHTTHLLGTETDYQDLKRGVLEFVANNANIGGGKSTSPDAMDIGQIAETTGDLQESPDESWDENAEQLAAVGPATQCHNCKGYGHIASQCPSAKFSPKGKGKADNSKGKGKGQQSKGQPKGGYKGKGKSQGQGPVQGCWTCGGAHYAQNCPKGASKGHQKGTYSFEEWPHPSNSTVHMLGAVTTHNRYALLADDAPVVESPNSSVKVLGNLEKAQGKVGAPRSGSLKDAFSGCHCVDKDDGVCRAAISYKEAVLGETAKIDDKARQADASGRTAAVLSPLATIDPEPLCPVGSAPEWEVVEMAVDSGASETVIPPSILQHVHTTTGEASKRGVLYEVANGERIPNLGEKVFMGLTDTEGHQRGVRAQVCDVSKPLMSVSRLVKAGHTVVFSHGGSYIVDGNTSERIALTENNGMFTLRLWVPTTSKQTTGF